MASKRASVIVPTRVYSGLELSRLEEIVDDDAKFTEYFVALELQEVQQAQKNSEQMFRTNKQLASETYNKKTEFEEKKAKVVDLSIRAAELKEAYNEKYEKLKTFSSKSDQKNVLKRLRDLSREIENDSEDLASGFLSGGSELRPEEFISQFRSKRTSYWLRKIKAEKMDKLIKEQPAQPSPSAFPPYPMRSVLGSAMPQPFPSSSSPQSMRAPPPKPTPYSVTHSVPAGSHPGAVQPTQSFPPSYVHGRNPGPSSIPNVPPPGYAQASRMPMPQSSYRPPAQAYPPPTASMYSRSPHQYGATPPAIGQPTYPAQAYPYGAPRPPYPPRT